MKDGWTGKGAGQSVWELSSNPETGMANDGIDTLIFVMWLPHETAALVCLDTHMHTDTDTHRPRTQTVHAHMQAQISTFRTNNAI